MLLPKETISSLGPAFHFPSGRASLGGGVLGTRYEHGTSSGYQMSRQEKWEHWRTPEMLAKMLASLQLDASGNGLVRTKTGRPVPAHIGSPTKRTDVPPYALSKVSGRTMCYHFMLWVVAHRRFPKSGHDIDHTDGDVRNNTIGNLREVSHLENLMRRHNTRRGAVSEYIGVSKVPGCHSRYRAGITLGGVHRHLGCFGSAEEAHTVYEAAKAAFLENPPR